jgi:hypothetical protein
MWELLRELLNKRRNVRGDDKYTTESERPAFASQIKASTG